MKLLQNRKGVSPIIVTVILVAVGITIAVGVSYWIGGTSSQYTIFEKVEIQVGYAEVITGGWNTTLVLKNSGSSGATLTHCSVNEILVDGYGATTIVPDEVHVSFSDSGLTIESGESEIVNIYISGGAVTKLTSGTTVNVKVHSSSGIEYTKLIKLP